MTNKECLAEQGAAVENTPASCKACVCGSELIERVAQAIECEFTLDGGISFTAAAQAAIQVVLDEVRSLKFMDDCWLSRQQIADITKKLGG